MQESYQGRQIQISKPSDWNSMIANLPDAHLLQTWEWSQIKQAVGWSPIPMIWEDNQRSVVAAALVLKRSLQVGRISLPLKVFYIPKGPLMMWENESLRVKVLDDLQDLARSQGAIFLKIDPDILTGEGVPGEPGAVESKPGRQLLMDFKRRGWLFSKEQIQFRNTVVIDLVASEDDLLARMKQKSRYNIRLAERKGVTIRSGSPEDFSMLYMMYAQTSLRDGFVIRDSAYYHRVWESFYQGDMLEPLIAEVDGQPVAAVMIFHFGKKAWYIYGMSLDVHREKMPNHLLQWQAMLHAKAAGCTTYDLWGAPDEFSEDDPMWGVFRFKQGLGGRVVRTMGAWDFTSRPLVYRLYTVTLPRILDFMRQRRKNQTKQEVTSE